MRNLTKLTLSLSILLLSIQNTFANGSFNTPEIDTSSAALGLGLMAGLVALISEFRQK